jgi:hypothetical protein
MSNTKTSGGIGLGTLVFLVLVILKATGQIAMSWFWVISSIIWAPLAMIGIILAFFGIIALIASAFPDRY